MKLLHQHFYFNNKAVRYVSLSVAFQNSVYSNVFIPISVTEVVKSEAEFYSRE